MLTLVPPTTHRHGDEQAADVAWGHVLDGIRRALTVANLPSDEEARLRRCYRFAAVRAQQRHLSVRGGDV